MKNLGLKINLLIVVFNLAKLAKQCRTDGIVFSPVEVIKKTLGKKFLKLVPGVSIKIKILTKTGLPQLRK